MRGWPNEPVRHSNARKLGRAGPLYRKKARQLEMQLKDEKEGQEKYMKLFKQTGNVMFKKMAMDEKRHYETLKKMKDKHQK